MWAHPLLMGKEAYSARQNGPFPTTRMKTMKTILAATMFAAFAVNSWAGDFTAQAGRFKGITRAAIGYETGPLYVNGNFEVTPAFELASLHKNGDSLTQISAVPMLRYRFSNGLFFEGGIGVSVFSGTLLADKEISTAFQFSDNLGIGYRFSNTMAVTYRISHYSNSDIKRPNPGIDMQQLVLAVNF
jgi:lipid A 3-O-deacylase